MAYDKNFPANDSFLADFPEKQRAQIEAIINDAIVNAKTVLGLQVGNDNGNIPIANGTECKNLNAGLLNGKTAGDMAPKIHAHDTATPSSNGFMSNVDKAKLNTIAENAQVNPNVFTNIKIGDLALQPDAKDDTLELVAGANIALTPDTTNDKINIAVTGTVPNAGAVNGHVFNWSGQGGQPTWLWGGNDASNMYVYNPLNFSVNYANAAAFSNTVSGQYTGSGGQQSPNYFGKNRAGFLMMNTPINGNANFKNFLIMDNYNGDDVGGATALGLDRQDNRAFIMRSNADRTTWNGSAELITSANVGQQSVNYANTAGNANAVNGKVFNWSGQGGQPTWLWGGNDGTNMYVYNPSNFNVNYANRAALLTSLSGDANYKLGYTADGQRTNAGEWGRVVMRYDPNGQTYGVRCDRADYADGAGSVQGYTPAQLLGSSNLSGNGWTKLPNGLILQWGRVNETGYNPGTISFQIEFPTACASVTCTKGRVSNASQETNAATASVITKTNFIIKANDAGTVGEFYVNWIAIGY